MSYRMRPILLAGILHAVLFLLAIAMLVCAASCTPAQVNKGVLVYGERETVCALVEQAAVSLPGDERVQRAKELCRAAADLQEIVDAVSTPCEDRK